MSFALRYSEAEEEMLPTSFIMARTRELRGCLSAAFTPMLAMA